MDQQFWGFLLFVNTFGMPRIFALGSFGLGVSEIDLGVDGIGNCGKFADSVYIFVEEIFHF